MSEQVIERFWRVAPTGDQVSIRYYRERGERIVVRQNVLQPFEQTLDEGVMITVVHRGGIGYAATSDVSEQGLFRAGMRAAEWANRMREVALTDFSSIPSQAASGHYEKRGLIPWASVSLKDKVERAREAAERLAVSPLIVDWECSLWFTEVASYFSSAPRAATYQAFEVFAPDLRAVANRGAETQVRTLGALGHCRQAGLELLEQVGFASAPERIAGEALQLLDAPDCPSDTRDLLLSPDQMMLQIHESIGHPLELDRILGDERNYAGTSFVTPDMFGSYPYGSELLNVTFDPSVETQLASYAVDDEGLAAERAFLIQNGILVRGLGSVTSQSRSELPGVANARSSSWNRPPIDRMANLNVEPGASSLDDMIRQTERGIWMKTNRSWSIDDSRNKFQFGCEWAQLIENGELGSVVKNPNYRGISSDFWRNLKAVGDASTVEVLGTPFCGKGEPNQVIRVGHASPICLFADVAVFGGDAS